MLLEPCEKVIFGLDHTIELNDMTVLLDRSFQCSGSGEELRMKRHIGEHTNVLITLGSGHPSESVYKVNARGSADQMLHNHISLVIHS
jgi:hypothetical protein